MERLLFPSYIKFTESFPPSLLNFTSLVKTYAHWPAGSSQFIKDVLKVPISELVKSFKSLYMMYSWPLFLSSP